MNRILQTKIHAASGTLGLLIILTFFVSTVIAEIGGDYAAIAAVKRSIAYGLLVLIPAMVAAGLSGNQLAGRSQAAPIRVKKKRMQVIGANGLFVLVPCALALHLLARDGSFGTAFYVIQGVELIAGPANIALMMLNVREGLRLSGRLRRA